MSMTTTRTDVHRPSQMDPADYVLVGEADDHHSEGSFDFDWERYAELKGAPELAGRDYRDAEGIEWDELTGRGTCCHCGQRRIRYWVFYLHVPTGKVVAVGGRCAGKLGLSSKDDLARRAQIERERLTAKLAAWREADERHVTVWDELMRQQDEAGGSGANDFVDSLVRYAHRNGELTEAQVAAVLKGIERAERDREMGDPEPAPVPLTTERLTIEGRIVSTKWRDDGFGGGSLKMLVVDDRGFRVYGTLPDALFDAVWARVEPSEYSDVAAALRGGMKLRVRFAAKVERSRKDETFGFYKRPTKAELIEETK